MTLVACNLIKPLDTVLPDKIEVPRTPHHDIPVELTKSVSPDHLLKVKLSLADRTF